MTSVDLSGFQKDAGGNVVMYAVTGYAAASVDGIAVLLAIQYATNAEGLQRGETRTIQFGLIAPACLQIAEILTKLGLELQEIPPGTRPQ